MLVNGQERPLEGLFIRRQFQPYTAAPARRVSLFDPQGQKTSVEVTAVGQMLPVINVLTDGSGPPVHIAPGGECPVVAVLFRLMRDIL